MNKELFNIAKSSRENSYSPYSRFKVGAAVKFIGQEKIFGGCNIENSSFGGCVCAERVAILKGLSTLGKHTIEKILVCTSSPQGDNPCGICLQTISEFSNPETKILIANCDKILKEDKLSNFIPNTFNKDNLP